MKRYWIRIALGAFGVFLLGMIVVSAGRHGVEHVKEAIAQHALNLTPGVAPFLVDSRRLGMLTQVEMDPENSQDFPFISMTVELDPNLERADLGDCTLVAGDAESLGGETGLQCLKGISRDSLVEMGVVTFQPSGEREGIYIPESQTGDTPWFSRLHRARHSSSSSAEGSLNLRADAAGAFMLIKDDKGRPIFQLNADSQGAFIQIRDNNGKEVVRFRADSHGVVGRVHSD